MVGIGPGGELAGRWVRTRTREDARVFLQEEQERSERRQRSRRRQSAAVRRVAWAVVSVLVVVGVLLTLTGA